MSDAVLITIIVCITIFLTSCAVAGIITGTKVVEFEYDSKKKSKNKK
ncbi:hypothetical protein FWH13_01110 [Candidatus Saccharibacteria bacterium]|nr:hypothetical protein [Candidatus Saccharibacteria bacterium]